MYRKYIKRLLDIICALLALIVFSPLFIILMILGLINMKGNPFFIQERPGYKEKIFKLIKFRTMTNEKDEEGNLLPDELRLKKYGKFLRSTSLDELPEAINILKGDMSVVGPRPLAVQYLPYYNKEERKRHDVKPGLSGWAQVNGRNSLNWEDKFRFDVWYVNNISFMLDVKVVFLTIKTAIKRENIGVRGIDAPIDFDLYRKQQKLNMEVH